MKKPYIASMDQIKIGRKGEYAIIEYKEPNVFAVDLKIGPEIQEMTDQKILDLHNEIIGEMRKRAREYKRKAIEIPPGFPQIKYYQRGDQWVPRGGVLRCVISDGGPEGGAIIHIDDQDLSLTEFGKLLCTYAGWGMRIIFVPDDELSQPPVIEVRDVEDEFDGH